MPRYAAFLRAVNVGGRVVKMDTLRTLFGAIGFQNVQTFIASGNVIFESRRRSAGALEAEIEKRLEAVLGYKVGTFLRTFPELAALAEHPVVSGGAVPAGATAYVVFLRQKPGREAERKLMALSTDVDRLELHDRQLLWLAHGRFSDSQLSGSILERTLSAPVTVRNSSTIRKIVEKYG